MLNAITTDPVAQQWIIVGLILLAGYLLSRLGAWIARLLLKSRRLFKTTQLKEGRLKVLRSLVSGVIQLVILIIAVTAALLQLGVSGSAIITALGLFSAAFGLSAQPVISDYLSGVILIFEDQFTVGEKLEVNNVTGIVESVNLRHTKIRSETGETYLVPNGSVRMVRNLSRGEFSVATITMKIATQDLTRAIDLLNRVIVSAKEQLPDLIQEPYYLNENGTLSRDTELTLVARTTYGKGAMTRPKLMALVADAFLKEGIPFSG